MGLVRLSVFWLGQFRGLNEKAMDEQVGEAEPIILKNNKIL